ncbi:Maf family protein [Parenemella sanctibonifatiensis]|uniref:Nucleoside triphosphate pyrophosphatase n=1 Tax=Parenemella sanctibonifatiensis TaxID=2016505 RepID=A0A255ERW3_9ACTN|nr:nucleoside triphosphate pyrophosphatase [Parenemella sanctibonifatiensis]OYN92192.1 septum formation inhibitor Maf [Parenemella sanctibonifatiensis]
MSIRLVLASQSPARLATLRRAGLTPDVIVSGVPEDDVTGTPAGIAEQLARRKALAVATQPQAADALVLGCDSVLELDGVAYGKPWQPDVATERWRLMRGRSGILHTGHCLVRGEQRAERVGSTTVHFADVSDAEIEAYVGTGEPLAVAGAFTLDGYGAGFVTGIEGDPHNVIGVSVPLLRLLCQDLGLDWPSLWQPSTGANG